jgi:hypothetical protein
MLRSGALIDAIQLCALVISAVWSCVVCHWLYAMEVVLHICAVQLNPETLVSPEFEHPIRFEKPIFIPPCSYC